MQQAAFQWLDPCCTGSDVHIQMFR